MSIYIYTSIHVGLGAAFLAMQNYLIQGEDALHNINYILLVFFGTTASYSMHRFSGIKELSKNHDAKKNKVLKDLKYIILIISLLSFVPSIIFLFSVDKISILILGIGFIITFLYNNPFSLKFRKWRERGNFKLILVALVWAMVTALVPAVQMEMKFFPGLFLFLERFIFILALTIPFDIRDIQTDSSMGFDTLVAKLGPERSLRIAMVLFLVFLPLIQFALYNSGILLHKYFIILLFSNIIIAVFVFYSRKAKSDLYYSGLLDAFMILQPTALILSSL